MKGFAVWVGMVVAVGLVMVPAAQAQDTNKPAKATTSKTKKPATKKSTPASDSCMAGSKKWRDGTHCMTSCNEQGTICDMRICMKGTWKPYSSCFGPKAVAPNCPAACE